MRLFDDRVFVRRTSRRRQDVAFDERLKDLIVIDSLNLVDVLDCMLGYPEPPALDSTEIDGFMRHLKVQARDKGRAVVVTASSPLLAFDPSRWDDRTERLVQAQSLGSAASIADQVLIVKRPELWDRNCERVCESDIAVRGAVWTVANYRGSFVDMDMMNG